MTMSNKDVPSADKKPATGRDAWETHASYYDPMRAAARTVSLTNESFYGPQARRAVEERRRKLASEPSQP